MQFEQIGKVVVEWDGAGFFVMFPDGDVRTYATAARVERAARKWFEKNTTKASVGTIEWPADRWPGRPMSLLSEVKNRKVA